MFIKFRTCSGTDKIRFIAECVMNHAELPVIPRPFFRSVADRLTTLLRIELLGADIVFCGQPQNMSPPPR